MGAWKGRNQPYPDGMDPEFLVITGDNRMVQCIASHPCVKGKQHGCVQHQDNKTQSL